MSREELERQQLGGLGDLTEPLKHERGELENQRVNYGPRRAPADLRQGLIPPSNQSPADKLTYDTLSVYELLPANAGHLSYGALATRLISTGRRLARAQEIFSKIVPQGRVAIVRAAKVNIDASTTGIPTTPYSFSLLRNGNIEVFNQDIFVQAFDDFYPVYLIAGPGDVISIEVSYDFTASLPIGSTTIDWMVHLTGDMLVTNELPIPYTGLKSSTVRTV